MYRPFQIFSVVTTLLTLLFLFGWYFHIPIFRSSTFLSLLSVYFVISGVIFLIFLFKDNGVIFAKECRFKNILLYFLTTPVPLILSVIIPFNLKSFKSNLALYRDITEYKICDFCLAEGSSVQVIYSSGGPEMNNNLDFYYHYIVVDKIKGDTLNVLTTCMVFPSTKPRYFISRNSDIGKIMQNLNKMADSSSRKNISSLTYKNITKVVYNPHGAWEENNNYQTTIGELGINLDK